MKKVIGLFALAVLMNAGIAYAKGDLRNEYKDKTVYVDGAREPDAISKPEYVTEEDQIKEQRLQIKDLK